MTILQCPRVVFSLPTHTNDLFSVSLFDPYTVGRHKQLKHYYLLHLDQAHNGPCTLETMSGRDRLDKQVEALEMEMLNEDDNEKSKDLKDTLAKYQMFAKFWFDKFVALIRLYYRVYPKTVIGMSVVLGCLLIKIIFFRHHGKTLYILPHLVNHFGDVQSYYDLKIGKIDHWYVHDRQDFLELQRSNRIPI